MVFFGLVILSLVSILFLSASATLVGVGSFEDNFEGWVEWWFVHFPLRGLFGGTYASIGAFVCFVAFLVAPGVFKSAYVGSFFSILRAVRSIPNQPPIASIDIRSYVSVPNGPAGGWW
jgi:hypothetical protein